MDQLQTNLLTLIIICVATILGLLAVLALRKFKENK